MSKEIIEEIIYDPSVPCILKCNEDLTDCDIDCKTITTTTTPTTTTQTTTARPSSGNTIWNLVGNNTDVIAGTVVVGGVSYVALEYVNPLL